MWQFKFRHNNNLFRFRKNKTTTKKSILVCKYLPNNIKWKRRQLILYDPEKKKKELLKNGNSTIIILKFYFQWLQTPHYSPGKQDQYLNMYWWWLSGFGAHYQKLSERNTSSSSWLRSEIHCSNCHWDDTAVCETHHTVRVLFWHFTYGHLRYIDWFTI